MKVFISWSGEPSHRVATLLRDQLPLFIDVETWESSEDIHLGTLWRNELEQALSDGGAGIFCLTRDNVSAPWVHYEAGSLAAGPVRRPVIPFLFRMRRSDLKGPLGDFQGAAFDPDNERKSKSDFGQILAAVNKASDRPTDLTVLQRRCDQMWPAFWSQLNEIEHEAGEDDTVRSSPDSRQLAIVEEVFEAVKDQRRILSKALGDDRWTFRGNARLDPLSWADYRQLSLGLAMLKTLAEIERLDLYRPWDATIRTLLMLRDPLEVLLARAHAPRIYRLYFDDAGERLRMTYTEEDREQEEEFGDDAADRYRESIEAEQHPGGSDAETVDGEQEGDRDDDLDDEDIARMIQGEDTTT